MQIAFYLATIYAAIKRIMIIPVVIPIHLKSLVKSVSTSGYFCLFGTACSVLLLAADMLLGLAGFLPLTMNTSYFALGCDLS